MKIITFGEHQYQISADEPPQIGDYVYFSGDAWGNSEIYPEGISIYKKDNVGEFITINNTELGINEDISKTDIKKIIASTNKELNLPAIK
jgi:hypothetical protein